MSASMIVLLLASWISAVLGRRKVQMTRKQGHTSWIKQAQKMGETAPSHDALAELRLSHSPRHLAKVNLVKLVAALCLASDQPAGAWQLPGNGCNSRLSRLRRQSGRSYSPHMSPREQRTLTDSRDYKSVAKFLQRSMSPLKIIDDVLDMWQDVEGSLKWANAFNGGLLPVEPVENITLQVKSGNLPEDLAGAFMRVGPNPQYWPPRKRTHSFDGDGMLHSVRIANGEATYHCQFLETPRFLLEQEYGKEWFLRIGEIESKWGLVKNALGAPKAELASLELWEAGGLANTAIAYTPEGKLWALHESSPPFRFRLEENGAPRSLGYDTLHGAHKRPMSAHPKIDQQTGEIMFHGRELFQSYFLAKLENDKIVNRCVLKGAPIVDTGGDEDADDPKMPPGFHHDIVITEKYMVIIDGSVRFSTDAFMDGSSFFRMNPAVNLRFGVMPRDCTEMVPEDIIWIETPIAAEIVHALHAYDDDGKIVLWAPMTFAKQGSEQDMPGSSGNLLAGGSGFLMRRVVLDLDQKSVVIEPIPGGDSYFTEYPRIRDDGIGRWIRYGYSAIQTAGSDFNFTGILKWDFKEGGLTNEITFPENVVGGEPVFIPRSSGTRDVEGDDGYLGMFQWNTAKGESTFTLYDAKTFSSSPVVELTVPRRVPIGFHGAWITEQQFQKQLKVT